MNAFNLGWNPFLSIRSFYHQMFSSHVNDIFFFKISFWEAQRVNPIRNLACTLLCFFLTSASSLSLVDSCGWPVATLLTGRIVRIFVVTLPSPLLTGLGICWHVWRHMPGSGAKHRASLQLKPRLSLVFLVAVKETFCPLLFPYLRCSHCLASTPPSSSSSSLFETLVQGWLLGYELSAQTWLPSPRQFFLND